MDEDDLAKIASLSEGQKTEFRVSLKFLFTHKTSIFVRKPYLWSSRS